MLWLLGIIGSLLLSITGFIAGRVFSQSEKILEQKRRSYEEFLRLCPSPNEAHASTPLDAIAMQRSVGVLSLYGSPDALQFAAVYFSKFPEAQEVLVGVEVEGHPMFIQLMTHYNRMVWAMRNDVMTWTIFAPARHAREYKPTFKPENLK